MAGKAELDVQLELASPGELSAAQAPDPLAGRLHAEYGMRPDLDQLRPRPGRRARDARVAVGGTRARPQSPMPGGPGALCDAKIAWIRNNMGGL